MDTSSIATLITTVLTPCLPYLLKVGEKAMEEAGKKIGSEAWEKSRAIWNKVKEQPAVLRAAENAARTPDDVRAKDNLNSQLKQLLDNDPELAHFLRRAVQAAPKIYHLYAPVKDFVGRQPEIEKLKGALANRESVSICGMSGTGKTQLGMLVAHQMRELYPDAQLFVAMQGKDYRRDPAEAVEACIRAFVGPEEALPKDTGELTARYHNVLRDKRALIVLDNAADGQQVRPLVPPDDCALIVTSIDTITWPGLICRVSLHDFEPAEARELLLKIVPKIDVDIADKICKLCGWMPLAIRAAGGFLDETDMDPAKYADHLSDERTRLDRIDPENNEAVSVEAAFNLSYERLAPEAARVFRKLAVFRSSFDAAGEEYVCEDSKQWHLSILEKRGLVVSAVINDKTKRYRLPNLGRLFAERRLDDEERYTAAKRHAEYYERVLQEASDMYQQGGESLHQALKLFDKERDNIDAGRFWTESNCEHDEGAAKLSIAYSVVGESLLSLRWPPKQRLNSLQISISCARRIGLKDDECRLFGNIGRAFFELGDFQSAIQHHEHQLAIARETGKRAEEGHALNGLGDAYLRLDPSRAFDLYEHALTISRETDDRQDEGRALNNLGDAYRNYGQFHRAIDFYAQQLKIAKVLEDVRSEGNALNNLGDCYSNIGQMRVAIDYHEKSLKIAHEIGTNLGKVNILNNLGNAYLAIGEANNAIDFYEKAMAMSNEIGYRFGEYMILTNLSEAYIDVGRPRHAIECLESALAFFNEIASRRGKGNALNNQGKAYHEMGEDSRAIQLYEQALEMARQIGSRHGEAHVLNDMGEAYAGLGDIHRANQIYEHVLTIFKEIGDKRGEGDVLFNLALACARIGDQAQAITSANAALEIYEQLESHKVSLVREQLARWESET